MVCLAVAASQQDSGSLLCIGRTDERCEVGKTLLVAAKRIWFQSAKKSSINRRACRRQPGRCNGN